MEGIVDWLLEGPAYIELIARRDLLKEDITDDLKRKVTQQENVKTLLNEVNTWPWVPIARHNDAKHPLHKLAFLSELGLHEELEHISENIISTMENSSPPRINTKLYKRWMGRDGEEYLWVLCDAPLQLYILAKLGYREQVEEAVGTLISLVRENGWRCDSDDKLGNFKGPGPRESVCPYSTLLMMRLISAFPGLTKGKPARKGAEALLQRWEQRGKEKPFLFGVGTDFSKLKAPLIWYDILHVVDVLSHFDFVHQDDRFREMMDIILSKEKGGMYTPESIWMAWRGWDFGQKKEPSRYITYKVLSILDRVG